MVPRADVPRSTFVTEHTHKTTFDAGWLVPIHVDEVLPGDTHKGRVTIFARLATPLFPIMDNLMAETFFFFCPNRLVWDNWKKMMGERANPNSSIDYTIPQVVSPAGGFAVCSLGDYFGLPTAGQVEGAATVSVNALPFRAYNFIYNEWFRDQNLQDSLVVDTDNGPDTLSDYVLRRRNKKHDYFTSCLPYPLKGGVEATLPLAGQAPVRGIAANSTLNPTDGGPGAGFLETPDSTDPGWAGYLGTSVADNFRIRMESAASGAGPAIYADLSEAAGATINALRLAFQTQRLLERDMRSGTRYTELLRAHFGVTPEDQRLQRPEYIGGGRTAVQTQAIAQTAEYATSPIGTLGAAAVITDQHSFSYNATEHGFIIGLVQVSAELTYQQGLHRMWTRQTRYDHYWPVFAHLGEQAVKVSEIYYSGESEIDDLVFGYQERWAELRHRPSRISGLFRSTSAGAIDEWHLAQQFGSAPALNTAFIQDMSDDQLERVQAAGSAAANMQILLDAFFQIRTTRAMPMYSVPGMTDRL